MAAGDNPTGEPCPLTRGCKGGIVYNGAYFCDTCDKTLPDTWSACKGGKLVPYLAGLIRYRRDTKGWDTTREERYLPDGHPDKLTPT